MSLLTQSRFGQVCDDSLSSNRVNSTQWLSRSLRHKFKNVGQLTHYERILHSRMKGPRLLRWSYFRNLYPILGVANPWHATKDFSKFGDSDFMWTLFLVRSFIHNYNLYCFIFLLNHIYFQVIFIWPWKQWSYWQYTNELYLSLWIFVW